MTYTRTIDFSRTRTSLRPFSVSLISPAVGRFTLAFHLNIRCPRDLRNPLGGESDGAWFFALSNSIGTVLVRSRRVVLSTNLLARLQPGTTLPPGVLRCTGPDDPGARDLGMGTCVLVYEET